jgi:translation initiation factor 1 (eIF-1/SUI1)
VIDPRSQMALIREPRVLVQGKYLVRIACIFEFEVELREICTSWKARCLLFCTVSF